MDTISRLRLIHQNEVTHNGHSSLNNTFALPCHRSGSMVFGGIVASPRSSLSAVQSLRLAKAYLECATKEQDMDVTLVLCHDTEVSLSQAKRSAKSNNHQMLHPEIAKAYTDLGDLLHNRGCLSEAKASYNKAEKYG
ncbi:hypothetical protein B0O80DRAFT_430460 [Mortierella sp. GBAus27b]|nr:hypothetical protein B0O80DRAFT_430460 [Mortierella sp. GBAus27b]